MTDVSVISSYNWLKKVKASVPKLIIDSQWKNVQKGELCFVLQFVREMSEFFTFPGKVECSDFMTHVIGKE